MTTANDDIFLNGGGEENDEMKAKVEFVSDYEREQE